MCALCRTPIDNNEIKIYQVNKVQNTFCRPWNYTGKKKNKIKIKKRIFNYITFILQSWNDSVQIDITYSGQGNILIYFFQLSIVNLFHLTRDHWVCT
jgi:hypothetical protein